MRQLHVHHGGQRGHQDGDEPVGVGAVGAVDQVHRRQLDVHLLACDPLQHVGQAPVVRVQLDLAGTVEYVVPARGKLKFQLPCKLYYTNRVFISNLLKYVDTVVYLCSVNPMDRVQ